MILREQINEKIRYLGVIVLLIAISAFSVSVYADDSPGHNAALRKVLFGNSRVRDTDKMDALNDACQLAIDQHNKDSQKILDRLRERVPGLPERVDEFDVGHGNLHRNYTHKGWDYEYKNDEAHWSDIRKKIILDTVNKEFDFGLLSNITVLGYDKRCESFSALMYYVHILQDHNTNTEFHKNYEEIPLVKGKYDKYGIIEELEKHCAVLFSDIDDTKEYRKLFYELEFHKKKIKKIYASRNDLYNSDTYEEYRKSAEKILDMLERNIPSLLRNEKFFKEAFY